MNWTHLTILFAIGMVHSALLWLITLGFKRNGLEGKALSWVPLILGVPSSGLGFPFAFVAVTSIRPENLAEWGVMVALGLFFGLPAAFGAEVTYRLAWRTMPRVVNALIGRAEGP